MIFVAERSLTCYRIGAPESVWKWWLNDSSHIPDVLCNWYTRKCIQRLPSLFIESIHPTVYKKDDSSWEVPNLLLTWYTQLYIYIATLAEIFFAFIELIHPQVYTNDDYSWDVPYFLWNRYTQKYIQIMITAERSLTLYRIDTCMNWYTHTYIKIVIIAERGLTFL